MALYEVLLNRLANNEVVILDGAVGTELQSLGFPIGVTAWAGVAQHTHPDTVQFMHEQYIHAGADIITTNTYSSARHCLEPLGLGELTRELNLRAVVLAQNARSRVSSERSILIAGSVSNFGILAGTEEETLPPKLQNGWSHYTEAQCRANLHEQAQILADSGVDFLLAEATGSTLNRQWVVEACKATGLPTWLGFKGHIDSRNGALMTGHNSNESFEMGRDALLPLADDVVAVFHTTIEATDIAIPIIKEKWDGPIAVYPDADRHDYVDHHADETQQNSHSPEEFLICARRWVEMGVQIIGGCCGFGVDYIRLMREGLPSHTE
jgi:S-methylmethionine-dependent homocysteine/selenocysteine methylase|tara:strand:- start:3320 stop:4291 length:972 start_codon:yes stop_codon:yes gene_type:complete